MQVWVVMKNEWFGDTENTAGVNSVHSVWRSESAADAEMVRQSDAARGRMHGPTFDVVGPFEVQEG